MSATISTSSSILILMTSRITMEAMSVSGLKAQTGPGRLEDYALVVISDQQLKILEKVSFDDSAVVSLLTSSHHLIRIVTNPSRPSFSVVNVVSSTTVVK